MLIIARLHAINYLDFYVLHFSRDILTCEKYKRKNSVDL